MGCKITKKKGDNQMLSALFGVQRLAFSVKALWCSEFCVKALLQRKGLVIMIQDFSFLFQIRFWLKGCIFVGNHYK